MWPAECGVTPRARTTLRLSHRARQSPSERCEIPGERPRDDQGGAAGALERNGLGHQLAHHDVQDVSSAKASASARLCARIAARLPGSQSSMGRKIWANVVRPRRQMPRLVSVMPTCTPETTRSSWPSKLLNDARRDVAVSPVGARGNAHRDQREFRRRRKTR